MTLPVAYKKSFEELVESLVDGCITFALLPLTPMLSGLEAGKDEDVGYPEFPFVGSYALWSVQHCVAENEQEKFQTEPVIRLNVIRNSPFGWVYSTQFELDKFECFNCPVDFLIHARRAFDLDWRVKVIEKHQKTLDVIRKVHDEVLDNMIKEETIQ